MDSANTKSSSFKILQPNEIALFVYYPTHIPNLNKMTGAEKMLYKMFKKGTK